MNWTTRRTAALAAAACLTALSAAALSAKHNRTHPKASPSASAPNKTAKSSAHATPAPNSASSQTADTKPTIDRASHGREPLESAFTAARISRGENIARTALAYRGVPYRFGGRSAQSGFDCSGLVQAVCAKWGIYLPRVAGAQFARGTAVKTTDLQPGDLVFFQGTYKRGLSHVGIFIGEGQFVHAAGKGKGVRISSLGDTYFQRHWAGGRRLNLKHLPKVRDEMPVLASEVIVDRPAGLAEPRGRFIGNPGVTPSGAESRDGEQREIAPRLR